MNEDNLKYVREMAVQQLKGLQQLAGDSIRGTRLELELKLALNVFQESDAVEAVEAKEVKATTHIDYDDEDYDDDDYDYDQDYALYDDDNDNEPIVPEGFENREEYTDFIETQRDLMPVVEDPDTGEEIILTPDAVTGYVNGKDVGEESFNENIAKVSDYIRETHTIYNEYTGEAEVEMEVEEVPFLKVSFKRNDGQELTSEQILNNVMSAPQSRKMLTAFGNNYNITDGNDASTKIVRFFIDNDDPQSRDVAQAIVHGNGMMTFGGRVVIPGLGQVTAQQIL